MKTLVCWSGFLMLAVVVSGLLNGCASCNPCRECPECTQPKKVCVPVTKKVCKTDYVCQEKMVCKKEIVRKPRTTCKDVTEYKEKTICEPLPIVAAEPVCPEPCPPAVIRDTGCPTDTCK